MAEAALSRRSLRNGGTILTPKRGLGRPTLGVKTDRASCRGKKVGGEGGGPSPESGGPGVGGGVSLREMPVRQRLREMEGDLLYLGEGFWVVFPHHPEKVCCLLKKNKKRNPVWIWVFVSFVWFFLSTDPICMYLYMSLTKKTLVTLIYN